MRQYGVKYQLGGAPQRWHDTMEKALADLDECLASAKAGGDKQDIYITAEDIDEVERFCNRCDRKTVYKKYGESSWVCSICS